MFSLFSPHGATGGNGAKAYHCTGCNALVTSSDRFLAMGGTHRHFFVNPAGMECDFYTFASCPGATAEAAATIEHTWFPGYQWRFAFCRNCGEHLGWNYGAVSAHARPAEFWGILIPHVLAR
jgi:hypothetical protein